MAAGPLKPEPNAESAPPTTFRLADYHALPPSELHDRAGGLPQVADPEDLQELVFALVRREHGAAATGLGSGILDVRPEGFGFLRHPQNHCRAGADDIYVSPNQIHRLRLRPGCRVAGLIRMPRTGAGERYFAMLRVETVDGRELAAHRAVARPPFADTTPILPRRPLPVAISEGPADLRMVDLLAPLAHGHRVLIRAGAGRWPLLHDLVLGLRHNHPTARVVCLLVDQATEDRAVAARAVASDAGVELYATTFDEPPDRHAALMDLVHERVQRLVENGDDVVLLVDSFHRLVRAFDAVTPYAGRIVAAGLDTHAFCHPKRLLSRARQTEAGPALTIIGTAGTGTPEDDAVAQEFAARCDAEIVFDPELDAHRTATRPECRPLVPAAAACHERLRARLAAMPRTAAREHLAALVAKTADNAELLARATES